VLTPAKRLQQVIVGAGQMFRFRDRDLEIESGHEDCDVSLITERINAGDEGSYGRG
jgi:hypothetical protein